MFWANVSNPAHSIIRLTTSTDSDFTFVKVCLNFLSFCIFSVTLNFVYRTLEI